MTSLCWVKVKRVENAHLKFHNIPSIFQFIVELAMHRGHWNESSICKKNKNGILVFSLNSLDLSFLRWATIVVVGGLLNPCSKQIQKNELWSILHQSTLKKFYEAKFNLEFDETIAIESITKSIFLKLFLFSKNSNFVNMKLKKKGQRQKNGCLGHKGLFNVV